MCTVADEGDKLKKDKALRLVKARRMFGGYDSARSAALQNRWNYNNYKAQEAGINGFSDAQARLYAKTFNVSLSWLTTGEGSPQGVVSAVEDIEYTLDNVLTLVKHIKVVDGSNEDLRANAERQLVRLLAEAKREQKRQ